MKKIISIALTLLLTIFIGTALAERSQGRSDYDRHSSQGERIERHLGIQGDRIERHFDRKAVRASGQGKYRKAHHFQKKGKRINCHLDHRGHQIHTRFNRRGAVHHRHHRINKHVVYPSRGYYYDNYFSLMIRQPGFSFGWSGYH